jgi:hypothetical protein
MSTADGAGSEHAIRQMAEARSNATEALGRLHSERGIVPDGPLVKPETVPNVLTAANSAIVQLAEHVRPYRTRVDAWRQDIKQVTFPREISEAGAGCDRGGGVCARPLNIPNEVEITSVSDFMELSGMKAKYGASSGANGQRYQPRDVQQEFIVALGYDALSRTFEAVDDCLTELDLLMPVQNQGGASFEYADLAPGGGEKE